jgi:HEAT repeat protein
MRRKHVFGLALALACALVPLNGASQTPDVPGIRNEPDVKSVSLSEDGKLVNGEPVEFWIEQSQASKAKKRGAANKALFLLAPKEPEAVRGLIKGLGDPDADVRDSVTERVEALLDDAKLIPVVAEGLDPSQPREVRRRIAYLFLYSAGCPELRAAVPALCAALKDEDALVRVRTARTLWAVDPNGADLTPIFVKALEDRDRAVRIGALAGIGRMGPSAAADAAAVAEQLKETDAEIEVAARLALHQMGKHAVPTLINLLGGESKRARARSAGVLEDIGLDAEAALPALYAAARDDDIEVRLSAAQALWKIEKKADRVAPLFTEIYGQGEVCHRVSTIRFFSEAWPKSPEALAGYCRGMRDPDEGVRRSAMACHKEAFLPLPDILIEQLVDSLHNEEENQIVYLAAERLRRVQTQAFPFLVPVCKEGRPLAREAAISLLVTDVGHQEKVAELCIRVLHEDTEMAVRCAAAEKLGRCREGNQRALAELLVAFKDPHPRVRAQVARVLSSLNEDGDAVSGALIGSLLDPEAEVRAAAAESLGRLRCNARDAVPALIDTLRDSDGRVERSAGMALGRFGPDAKAAIPDLVGRLGYRFRCHSLNGSAWKDADPTDWPSKALGLLGIDAVPAFCEALKHDDKYVREHAAFALERIGPKAREAIPQLKKLLSDPDEMVRSQAMEALKAIDPELAKKLLFS